jgi:hypothetical protein
LQSPWHSSFQSNSSRDRLSRLGDVAEHFADLLGVEGPHGQIAERKDADQSLVAVEPGLELKHNKAGVSLDGSEGTGVPSS